MRVAAVIDSEGRLVPLDKGNRIVLLNEAGEPLKIAENPGFGFAHGGKEQAMETILSLNADVVAVKKGFLCPCSYEMSQGKVKYAIVPFERLEELRASAASLTPGLKGELEADLYAEAEGHHHRNTAQSRTVNADVKI
jgi:hypothetical protein